MDLRCDEDFADLADVTEGDCPPPMFDLVGGTYGSRAPSVFAASVLPGQIASYDSTPCLSDSDDSDSDCDVGEGRERLGPQQQQHQQQQQRGPVYTELNTVNDQEQSPTACASAPVTVLLSADDDPLNPKSLQCHEFEDAVLASCALDSFFAECRIQSLVEDAVSFAATPEYLAACTAHPTDPVTYEDRDADCQLITDLTDLYKESIETKFLAQNIYDRFLSVFPLKREFHRLAATSSWFIAVKMSTSDRDKAPLMSVVGILDNQFPHDVLTVENVKQMETVILHHLKWRLSAVTVPILLAHMLPYFPVPPENRQALVSVACTVLQHVGQHYDLLPYSPVIVALSTINCAFHYVHELRDEDWLAGVDIIDTRIEPFSVATHSKDLYNCTGMMLDFLDRFLAADATPKEDEDSAVSDMDSDDCESIWSCDNIMLHQQSHLMQPHELLAVMDPFTVPQF